MVSTPPAAAHLRDPESGLQLTVHPHAGMLISSLRHHDAELLGQRRGLQTYLRDGKTMGIPLLHPWANRLAGDRFTVAGVPVDLGGVRPGLRRDPSGLPMHGLLAGDPGWAVERGGDGADQLMATFDFAARPDLLESFPFPHRLSYALTLQRGALTIELTVTATSDQAVPVAHGLHPYLTIPGVAREEWEISLPARERLALDARGLPTGTRSPEPELRTLLAARTFDDAYAAIADGATFTVAGGERCLTTTFETGFPAAQVFAPADDAVICFEPMAAPTGALSAGTELPLARDGAPHTARVRIAVSPR